MNKMTPFIKAVATQRVEMVPNVKQLLPHLVTRHTGGAVQTISLTSFQTPTNSGFNQS